MAGGELARAAGASGRAPRKSETTTARPRRRAITASRRMPSAEGRSCPARGAGAVTSRWSRAIRWSLPPRAGTVTVAARGEQHGADAVAGAGGEEADGGGGRRWRGRASRSRRCRSRGRATGRPATHVSSSRSAIVSRTWGSLEAGGDVPVDAADVVAGLVAAGLAELGAVPGHEAQVLAVQQAVEAPADSEVEAAQHLVRGLRRMRGGTLAGAGSVRPGRSPAPEPVPVPVGRPGGVGRGRPRQDGAAPAPYGAAGCGATAGRRRRGLRAGRAGRGRRRREAVAERSRGAVVGRSDGATRGAGTVDSTRAEDLVGR